MNSILSNYKGCESRIFELEGHLCTVVIPKNPDPKKRWIWRAEFLGAFDSVDLDMLSKGFYLCYCAISDKYGCPEAVEMMKKFYDFLIENGFYEKTVIFGFSRGGLYAVNFALKYPETVFSLYLDAPVLDIKSWPGGLMTGIGAEKEFEECLALYGLDRKTVLSFKQNPVDRIGELIAKNIPIALVAGDSDEVVPYCENGEILAREYERSGADILKIVKPGCGHHPHSINDPTPVTEFLIKTAKI